MPHDLALIAETRAWLEKAAEDLAAAALDLAANPPLCADTAFHAQQAVEKALKAFLTWHGREFRKTHNLIELGQHGAEVDSDLEPLLRKAAPLTEYAWKFRYPGDPERPSQQEAEEALAIARRVYDAVVERLPGTVHR
jgi:HEPN domain-containing protein